MSSRTPAGNQSGVPSDIGSESVSQCATMRAAGTISGSGYGGRAARKAASTAIATVRIGQLPRVNGALQRQAAGITACRTLLNL
jgi:hypothetical protein